MLTPSDKGHCACGHLIVVQSKGSLAEVLKSTLVRSSSCYQFHTLPKTGTPPAVAAAGSAACLTLPACLPCIVRPSNLIFHVPWQSSKLYTRVADVLRDKVQGAAC